MPRAGAPTGASWWRVAGRGARDRARRSVAPPMAANRRSAAQGDARDLMSARPRARPPVRGRVLFLSLQQRGLTGPEHGSGVEQPERRRGLASTAAARHRRRRARAGAPSTEDQVRAGAGTDGRTRSRGSCVPHASCLVIRGRAAALWTRPPSPSQASRAPALPAAGTASQKRWDQGAPWPLRGVLRPGRSAHVAAPGPPWPMRCPHRWATASPARGRLQWPAG
jgi:hypothetical protein